MLAKDEIRRFLRSILVRGPFDRGHMVDRVDRGNALRKCTANTKAALYRVPFRASRISQGRVSSKNKEMFCESNTIGPSNNPGIPLNGAKKHYTVLPFLECVCFWYPLSPFLSNNWRWSNRFPELSNFRQPICSAIRFPSTINRTRNICHV